MRVVPTPKPSAHPGFVARREAGYRQVLRQVLATADVERPNAMGSSQSAAAGP